MISFSRTFGMLGVIAVMDVVALCPAAEPPVVNRVVVEHVRQKPKPPEGGLGTTFYAPSKDEASFYKKLEKSEQTTGGHDTDYDIGKKAGKYVGWFGIVREFVEDKAKQQTVLTVEHKYFDGLTDTHIMSVSFNGSGDFQAILPGTGHQIGSLSLVRIYGTVAAAKDQPLPRLDAVFVRDWHWETFN